MDEMVDGSNGCCVWRTRNGVAKEDSFAEPGWASWSVAISFAVEDDAVGDEVFSLVVRSTIPENSGGSAKSL